MNPVLIGEAGLTRRVNKENLLILFLLIFFAKKWIRNSSDSVIGVAQETPKNGLSAKNICRTSPIVAELAYY
jgi:hypothetical protein